MGVYFEELAAPKLHIAREKSTGTREIWIPNPGDLGAFLLQEFPSAIAGYPQPDDFFPGLPWIYLASLDFEGHSDRIDGATPPNPVNGWKVTANYESKPYSLNKSDNNSDLPGGGQGGGPGGGAGSSDVMLSYEVDIGGNFQTFPAGGLAWLSDNKKAPKDAQFGVGEVSMDHSVTWHSVGVPPWGAIRRCAGRVNNGLFLGALRQCLLFVGVNASREFDMSGSRAWTLKFRFSEKLLQGAPIAANALGITQAGWNHFLRPDLAPVAYDMLFLAGQNGANSYAYPEVDMSNLFLPGGT